MSNEQDSKIPDTEIGWYISDTHARRAIGYLSGAIPELHAVTVPVLADAWAEALEKTMNPNERSPIGPETGLTHNCKCGHGISSHPNLAMCFYSLQCQCDDYTPETLSSGYPTGATTDTMSNSSGGKEANE